MTSGKTPAAARISAIRSEADLDRALEEFCKLAGNSSAGERLDKLASLIEKYEEGHHPIPEPSHAALLKHLLAARKGGVSKLSKAAGISVKAIKAILDGTRQIEPEESGAFAKFFSVHPSVFEPEPDGLDSPTLR